MMTMKLAMHAMARITPGGTCGRTAGSAKAAGAAAVLRWDMTATPFGEDPFGSGPIEQVQVEQVQVI
jgi:hypothetical protein